MGFWTWATLASALALNIVTDAPESNIAVVRLGSGGPAQPGGSYLFSTMLHALFFTSTSPPAALDRHSPFFFLRLFISATIALRPVFSGISKQSLGTCRTFSRLHILQCCPVTKW